MGKINCRSWVYIFFCLTAFTFSLNIQSQDFHAIYDYYGNVELGKSWDYEGNFGMEVLLQQNGWYQVYYSNAVSVDVTKWYGLEGDLEFYRTFDPVSYDISEVSASLVQTFVFEDYIHAIHLRKPYFGLKLEQRFLYYPEADTSDNKTRMRFKIGGKFLLNRNEIVVRTLFIPFYFEGYYNLNGEALEQKAAKAKASLGLGYIFSKQWMGEFNYKIQLARNSITDDVSRSDILFRLLIRYRF
jgi:hypothetical protein